MDTMNLPSLSRNFPVTMNQTQAAPKIFDKKLKNAELKVTKILNKIESVKLNNYYLGKLQVSAKKKDSSLFKMKLFYLYAFGFLILIVVAKWIYNEWPSNGRCTVPLPSSTTALFRPPEDCMQCAEVTSVVRLANTSAGQFEQYAYSAVPVIVTDATVGWKAVQEFNFNFFANFYRDKKLGKQINDCFFFAYKSGLHSLQDVFSMDEARANLSGDPWYIGWSTCYDEETRKLRGYYTRPYFLPETAESDMVDWIFMGGPGEGAHMHVDSVRHMSWQAQLRGRKVWHLAPAPECLYRCHWITFTVHPGEILVVDTNRWYHKTTILPGDISITIGAEYD